MVDGKPADLFDQAGRLIISPNLLGGEGRINVECDLQPGESLAVFLRRHVDGLDRGGWLVEIDGCRVPQPMWSRTWPRHGTVITVRGLVHQGAMQIVAMAALAYFTIVTGGAGAALMGAYGGIGAAATLGAAGLAAVTAGINVALYIGGSLLINKVLGPKKPTTGAISAEQTYSLTSTSNRARQYEPLALLLGEVQYAPDYASLPYTWFEGDDQYLGAIFHAGLNVNRYEGDILNGDTSLANYEEVEVFNSGFTGMAEQAIPLFSNPDTTQGGELVNGGAGLVRTASPDAVALQVDIEGTLYDLTGSGKTSVNAVTVYVDYRAVGTEAWIPGAEERISHGSTKPLRRTLNVSMPRGNYEVMVRAGLPQFNDGDGKDACTLNWTQLKTLQADDADYTGMPRLALRIRSSGQLNGALEEVKIRGVADPMPVWDGSAWQTATGRDNGLSNPGAEILLLARGIYIDGRLVAGLGLDDDMIDIERIKAFMLHCSANAYTYDRLIDSEIGIGELLDDIALAGMGQITWAGGRLGVSWAAPDQVPEGVVNMAVIKSGTFSVNYSLASSADGIEYTYFDRTVWANRTVRVTAPGVSTAINPSRVTGNGVTEASHAARMARYHLAQSIYQYKDIGFDTDLEHLDYRRMDMLQLSHDMTQWGYSGRLYSEAELEGGNVVLELDEPVPAGSTPFIGLRIPGEKQYRVFVVEPPAAETTRIRLTAPWPSDVPMPGWPFQDGRADPDNPAHDTIWIYGFTATPGYRVRVVEISPTDNLEGASVAVVPEGPEFWNYVINGEYEPPADESLLPGDVLPVASNLKVTEQQIVQSGTTFTELTVSFDIQGNLDHAEIWAALEGLEPVRVATTYTRQASWRADLPGNWLIQVRPFSPTRPGPVASLYYVTTTVDAPPWNYNEFSVQEIAGGMRRYVFAYTSDDPPIDLEGAEIRYLAGSHATPAWDVMSPLGGDNGFFTAQFDSALPQAGLWTFALRARNKARQLSASMLVFQAALGDNFDQVQTKDPTPPPDVAGLTATAGITGVLVDFTAPTYTQGHGHDRTVIFAAEVIAGAPAPSFADARVRVEPYGPPAAMASDPATTWDIWAKHRTVDGVLSANAAGPVRVTTAQDPAKLLEALEGAIGQQELTPEFQGEIAQQKGRTDTLEVEVRGARRREDDEGILADVINQWTSRAAIREVRQVVAGIDGTLQATWAVEMELDANGQKLAGGFSLIGSSGEEGSRLDFGILANRFYIGSPIGDGIEPVTPFIVVTVPEEINGVEVPPGVYMRSAVIMNGSITNAQIGNAQIDSAKVLSLDAALLTAGEGIIGGRLRSANYVANESGWIVHPNGTAEFSGVVVRGTVYATAGTVGGWIIGSTEIRSSNYVAGAQGVRLGSGGQVEMRSADSQRVLDLQAAGSAPVLKVPGLEARADGSATFGGALQAASGTFSGDLQAAGGTFKGTLTADAVNAVQEVNIAGNAVSVTTAGLAGDVGAEQWTSGNDVMYQNAVQIYVEPSAHSKTIFWSAYARGMGGGTTHRCRIRIQFLVDGNVVDEREFLNADGYYFVDSTGETPVPGWMYPIEHNSVNGQHLDTANTGRTYALRAAIGGDFSEGYVRILRSQITAITLKK